MSGFLRDMIAIPGESSQEKEVVQRIGEEMEAVGFDKVDIAQAKVFIMGILHFTPQSAVGLNPLFFTHVALVSVLLIYFPFSKLMHMGGIFMSPTRNMRCNTREVRHVNPWNNPNAPYRTYAEYEDDFRDLMAEAGLPLEKQPEDVEPAAPAPSK